MLNICEYKIRLRFFSEKKTFVLNLFSKMKKQEGIRKMIIDGLQRKIDVHTLSTSLNVSLRTIRRVKAKGTPKRSAGSGRKGKLTTAQKTKITKTLKNRKGASLRKLVKEFHQKGENISRTSIQRYVHKQPWGTSRVLHKKPKLSQKNINDRKSFYQHLTSKYCILNPITGLSTLNKILFTDEAPVFLHPRPNKQNYRVYSEHSEASQYKQWKGEGSKLVVAAGVSASGFTDLYIFPPNQVLNSNFYIDELLPFYQSQIKKLYKSNWRDVFLQEDGATPHRSKVVNKWKSEKWKSKLFSYDENMHWIWPGNSPDLNPIENVWPLLQNCVFDDPVPQNMEQLRLKIVERWTEIQRSESHTNLIESFVQRLRLCRDFQGDITPY
eukprot:c19280_g1_i2.p1 GENE.c19280_g1_i2~~c19280_g1_i2.p1  ORF type:complete len:382 (+),score=27.61 c19280_g1_i2:308-1453(+)